MYTHSTPSAVKWIYPSLIWSKNRREKKLYLTFDDGPVPDATEFVLGVLEKFEAKATFFCVGENVKKNPSIFKDIIKKGHAVGNHTYNHLDGWKTPNNKYFENVLWCKEVMEKEGFESENHLFRPPYGKIRRSQINKMNQDHQVIMWDVLSGDFDKKLSAPDCLKNTIKATRNGSIIVFHDSIKAEATLKWVLPRYLKELCDKGYTFHRL